MRRRLKFVLISSLVFTAACGKMYERIALDQARLKYSYVR